MRWDLPECKFFSLKKCKRGTFNIKYIEYVLFQKGGSTFSKKDPAFSKHLGPKDPGLQKPSNAINEI